MIFIFSCSAMLVKFLDNQAYHYYNEYSIVNCPEIHKTYSMAQLEQEAGYYYMGRQNLTGQHETPPPDLDMVSCFCNAQGYTNLGTAFIDKDHHYNYTEPSGKVNSIPTCKSYKEATRNSMVYGKLICTKSIVIINLIIRFVVIQVSEEVGYKTNQDMLLGITRVVFIAQFINTGLLLMLSEASLQAQEIPGIS